MGKMGIYVRTSVDKDNTSIEQQIKIEENFCKKNNFEYQVYDDKGKSGYSNEDEKDPFKNRPDMKRLIADIEDKIIDKIWISEFSRLGRDEYAGYLLQRIFIKNNITIYENDRPFDMSDPMNKLIQGIVSQVNQYERYDIIRRSKRGVQDTINRGIRGFNELYGYRKEGKINTVSLGDKTKKYMKWTPVNSEIENLKYLFQEYSKGKSVNFIIMEIFKNKIKEKERANLVKKFSRLLRQFAYTGYCLNIDGLEIYNKFMKCEIDSIKELKDKKYYVKSITFPVKIVSIENWIKCAEKSQHHKIVYKDRMRRTNTEILTGIVSCPYCEMRYYLAKDKGFNYYKHQPKKLCGQLPKSVRVEKLNNLFSVFFFYFYLVYDDTKNLIEENQKIIKMILLGVKDKIKTVEIENRKYEKQLGNFQSIYEETQDKELLKLTLVKEKELTLKIETNKSIILKLNEELEELNKKYDQAELELTYYNIEELIINFLRK